MTASADLYVYALAGPGLPPRFRVRKRSLRVLTIGEVRAVVEARSGPPAPEIDALREQHALVALLADRCEGALLPVRFGTTLREARLRDAVHERHETILETLALVRGRRQMTVRLFGEPERPEAVPVRPSSGTAFLEARRALARRIPGEVSVIRGVLGDLAHAERIEPGERTVRVTVYHLVDVGAIDVYRRRATALPQAVAPHRVAVTGPWPAFAFAPDVGPDRVGSRTPRRERVMRRTARSG